MFATTFVGLFAFLSFLRSNYGKASNFALFRDLEQQAQYSTRILAHPGEQPNILDLFLISLSFSYFIEIFSLLSRFLRSHSHFFILFEYSNKIFESY